MSPSHASPPSPTDRSLDTTRRPLVLIWELTQACALACDHCRADAQPARHPDELTTAEGKALLESAREFGDGQLVVLSGGDPLVRDDVDELVAHGTDLGLRMTMTPSGTQSLTRQRIDTLSDAGLRRMAVSLDGASAETHDSFRGESGSFEATIRAIEDARAAGVPVQVNTTVCQATVDELPVIRALLRDIGVVMWSVFFLVPVGRGRVLESISPTRADEVMSWLEAVSESEPFGVKTTEAPQYRRVCLQSGGFRGSPGSRKSRGSGVETGADMVTSRDLKSDTDTNMETETDTNTNTEGTTPPTGLQRRGGIVAGDGFAFVSHTGEVYPSGFLPKSAGSVRERALTELYRESDLFTALRDRDRLSGKCGACPYRAVCGGSRSRAYAHSGDPLASDPLCPYVPAGYDGELPWDDPDAIPTPVS
ncbi:TIGR04053 family radical SAM/SPASM domain-containing protein [Natrialba sp. SSL1]|uniref:TIGR04053 family radical SAM/SPASM domain-containing protein n=1 Tax=Natrialba sp. SSL1 TaxID=1869245 RepID=UPI0008F8D131|nr:TIGR04053 family radical SAM/SPASM domain-containing protein [Natrialba sp. SSL1]OIB59076.1 radical SAM/SPASM domain-containing protein [Natrialba sp. SSL1]